MVFVGTEDKPDAVRMTFVYAPIPIGERYLVEVQGVSELSRRWFDDEVAANEYVTGVLRHPDTTRVDDWRIARGTCLIRLKQSGVDIRTLSGEEVDRLTRKMLAERRGA